MQAAQPDAFPDLNQATGLIDDAGSYRISGLASGSWLVTATTDSGRRASGAVTLAAGAGAPVAGATVTLAGAAPGVPAALVPKVDTAIDGTFTIGPVVVGAYQVTVAKEGLEPGAAAVTVEPHATAQALIEIRPAGSGYPPPGG